MPNTKLREEFSQESRQGSLLRPELKDFIRRVVVPILVDRCLTKTKTIEHPEGGRIIHRMKPTYAEIAECVKRRHGFVPKTCWIAHVKELNGLPVRVAPNRQSRKTRMVPCPSEKRASIEDCFRRLGVIR